MSGPLRLRLVQASSRGQEVPARWQRAELRGAALSDPSPGVSAGSVLFSRHVSKELCGQHPCPVLPEAVLAGGDTAAAGWLRPQPRGAAGTCASSVPGKCCWRGGRTSSALSHRPAGAAEWGQESTANWVSGTERHRALAASPGRVEVRQVLVSAKGSELVPCISADTGLFAASFTLLQ